MPNYSIDWGRLTRDFVPAMLRKPRLLAFVNALASPVVFSYDRFINFRKELLDDLMIGPEVRVLEYQLNQRYDISDRRIEIIDGPTGGDLRIFTEAENQPIYLPTFMASQPVDFIVIIPELLLIVEPEIRRFVDRYKLPTKTYRVETPIE